MPADKVERWGHIMAESARMFSEAGVELVIVNKSLAQVFE